MRLNNVRGNWNMKRVVTFCLASGCTASREPGLIYCYYLETFINYVNLLFTFFMLCLVCRHVSSSFLFWKVLNFFVLHQILSGVSHSSRDFINCLDEFLPQFFFVFLHIQQNFIYNVDFKCLQFEIRNHDLGPKWIRSILSKILLLIFFLNCQRCLWLVPILKWCSSYINRKGKNGENCGAHLDMACIMLKRSMHFSCVLWETLPWWRRRRCGAAAAVATAEP